MIKVNYFDIDIYKTNIIAIDDIYYDITNALEDVGYMYYDTLECRELHLHLRKHIYKNKSEYYIVKNVKHNKHFIINIELANITDFINERWY